MSVARPAVALRRGLTQRILGARFATTDSTPIAGPSAPSPPKNQNQGKHYDPTLTHNVLPYHVIPRPQKYTSPFEYQPLHKSINHPRPVFVRPTNPADIPEYEGENRKEKRELALAAVTGLEPAELRKIRRTTIALKRVCRMSKKGKQYSWLAYVLVGMPDKGMVGFGRGRSNDSTVKAIDDAFFEACVEMDYVNRYEDRTLWGQGAELRTKFVRTQVDLRARPPGFGLQVPPPIHRVLSACGVRDASASINGSMNAVMVTKAVIQVLHGGGNPPGFGGGRFGSGKRKNKGHGMRSKEDIERQRGRYGVDIGLRV